MVVVTVDIVLVVAAGFRERTAARREREGNAGETERPATSVMEACSAGDEEDDGHVLSSPSLCVNFSPLSFSVFFFLPSCFSVKLFSPPPVMFVHAGIYRWEAPFGYPLSATMGCLFT